MKNKESEGIIPSLTNEIKTIKDPFAAVRAMMSYPIWNWVQEYFMRLRDYERAMEFVCYCTDEIDKNAEKCTADDLRNWFEKISGFTLALYDHLNLWEFYIEYFDELLEDKSNPVCYRFPNEAHIKPQYIIRFEPKFMYVHRLATLDFTYNQVKHKLEQANAGHGIERLKRKQQDKLTDEEIAKRHQQMVERLFYVLRAKGII